MGKYSFGDVAMVRNRHGVWNRCIYTLYVQGAAELEGWRPGVADTFYPVNAIPDFDVRLLAVIDYGDDDSVQGLLDALRTGGWVEPSHARPLKDVLNEHANGGWPGKAKRPAAIGAVVEDHEETFVHIGGGEFVRAVPNYDEGIYIWSDFSDEVKIISSAGAHSG